MRRAAVLTRLNGCTLADIIVSSSRAVSPGTGTGTRPSLLLYINDGPGGLVVYSTVDLVDESTCENYQGFTCEVSSEAATARSRSTHCGSIGARVLTVRLVIVHLQEPEC
jgi:hypothetical protein